MRGMGRIGVESLLTFELGVKHDIASVIDMAMVQTHFEMKQPRHFAAQLFEAGPQEFRRLAAILLRIARHIPHHDMLDHSAPPKASWILRTRMMKSSPERLTGQSRTSAPPCDEDAKSASRMRFMLCACCAGTFEGAPVRREFTKAEAS